jgi:hypothetical protein
MKVMHDTECQKVGKLISLRITLKRNNATWCSLSLKELQSPKMSVRILHQRQPGKLLYRFYLGELETQNPDTST